MKQIDSIQLFPGSDEEQLPDYTPDFPCITTRANLHKYADPRVPWPCPPASACWRSGLWMWHCATASTPPLWSGGG